MYIREFDKYIFQIAGFDCESGVQPVQAQFSLKTSPLVTVPVCIEYIIHDSSSSTMVVV